MKRLIAIFATLLSSSFAIATPPEAAGLIPSTLKLQGTDGSFQTFVIDTGDFMNLRMEGFTQGERYISINQWSCQEPNKFKGFLAEPMTLTFVAQDSSRKTITIDPAKSRRKIVVSESCTNNPPSNSELPNGLRSMIIEHLESSAVTEH